MSQEHLSRTKMSSSTSDPHSHFLRLSENTLPLSQRIDRGHKKRLIEPAAQIDPQGQRTLRFGDGYRLLYSPAIPISSELIYRQRVHDDNAAAIDRRQPLDRASKGKIGQHHVSRSDRSYPQMMRFGQNSEITHIVNKPWLTLDTSYPDHTIPLHKARKLSTPSDCDSKVSRIHGKPIHLTLNQETGLIEEALPDNGMWTHENTPEAELDFYMAKLANNYHDLESHMIILLFQQYLDSNSTHLLRLKPYCNHPPRISTWDKFLCGVIMKARSVHIFRLVKANNSAKIASWFQQERATKQQYYNYNQESKTIGMQAVDEYEC